MRKFYAFSIFLWFMLSCITSKGQSFLGMPKKYQNPTLETDNSLDNDRSDIEWIVHPDNYQNIVFSNKKLTKKARSFQFLEPLIVVEETAKALGVVSISKELETDVFWMKKDDLILWSNQVIKNNVGSPIRIIRPDRNSASNDYEILSLIKWDKPGRRFLVTSDDTFIASPDNAKNIFWVKENEAFILESRIGFVPHKIIEDETDEITDVLGSVLFKSNYSPKINGESKMALLLSESEVYELITILELIEETSNLLELKNGRIIATHLSLIDHIILKTGIALHELSSYDENLVSIKKLTDDQYDNIKSQVTILLDYLKKMNLTSYPYRQGFYLWLPIEDIPLEFFPINVVSEEMPQPVNSMTIIYADPYESFSNEMLNACSKTIDSLLNSSHHRTIHGLVSGNNEKVISTEISSNGGKRSFITEISRIEEYYRAPDLGAQYSDKKDIREHFYRKNINPADFQSLTVFLFVNQVFLERYSSQEDSGRWILPQIFQELHYVWTSKETVVYVIADSRDLGIDIAKENDPVSNLSFRINYLK